jgi:hypothetical protein
MASLRDELHTLIDQLPDDAVERLVIQLRQNPQDLGDETLAWLERARRFRSHLSKELGDHVFDPVRLLEETREERLNDILGSE